MPRLPAPLRPLFPYAKPAYVRLTEVVAPVTATLSRLHGRYLPTATARTMEQAAAGGGRCVEARPAEVVTRPTFEGYPDDLAPLEPAGDTDVERVAVVELPGARVLGPHRAVITSSGSLLQEVGVYFGTSRLHQHPVFWNPFPARPRRVEGRLGVLASRGDANYYHFLIDVLPRLGVLEQARGVAPPDRWYVPATTRFQRELLDMMGVTAECRIDSDEFPHVQAQCLVVPGLASPVGEKNPPWVVEFLRRRLLGPLAPPPGARRLYATRSAGGNNRAVADEDALVGALEARGFEVFDPGAVPVREQMVAFAGASVIVAPHGAALANLVFAPPGALVVELFPPGCVLPDYWRLASSAGLRYRYFSKHRAGGRRLARNAALVSDIEVDLDALGALLDAEAPVS